MNRNSGYITLTTVIVTTLLITLLYIPLQFTILSHIRNTRNQTNTRITYYQAESALNDTIAQIIATDYGWPTANIDDTLNTEPTINRKITLSPNRIDIIITAQQDKISRQLSATLIPTAQSAPADIILSFDTSLSMREASSFPCDTGAGNPPPCEPINTARNAATILINNILDYNEQARFGIITFTHYATPIVELDKRDDYTDIEDYRNYLINTIQNIEVTPPGQNLGTNIGDGIYQAYQQFTTLGRPQARYSIVLLTDGSSNYRGIQSAYFPCEDNPIQHNECTHNSNNLSTTTRAILAKQQATIFTIGLNLSNLAPQQHQQVAIQTLEIASTLPISPYFKEVSNYATLAQLETELNDTFSAIADQINKFSSLNINESQN